MEVHCRPNFSFECKLQVDNITHTHDADFWQTKVLTQKEYGGMQESLYNLYSITGNPDHLR